MYSYPVQFKKRKRYLRGRREWKISAEEKPDTKKSGRDESIRVVIHLCMQLLGISLYSYPYLN
jgi:hypothetical protein